VATEDHGNLYVARVHDGPIDYDTVIIEKLRVRAAVPFTAQFIESMRIETWREFAVDTLIVALEAEVLCEKLGEKEHHIEETRTVRIWVPKTWWHHLKATMYRTDKLSFWTRRQLMYVFSPAVEKQIERKVRFSKTVVTEQFATFPHSPIRMPEQHRGHQIFRYERSRVED
jgi:hypothetical protein